MSPEEAENAKRSGGLPDDFEAEVLRPFMENLATEVQRALQFFFTSTPVPQRRPHPARRRLGRDSGPGRGRDTRSAQVPTIVAQSLRRDADLAARAAEAADGRRAVADRRLRPGDAQVRSGMSVRVNLLPHREERRKRAAPAFLRRSPAAPPWSACCVVGAMHTFYQRQIDDADRPQRAS